MARGRMISKSLSNSKKWNLLPSWFARTLYQLLVVHSDDYGIVEGDAEDIKFNILPRAKESIQAFESALAALQKQKLIHRYKYEGHQLIEIIDFDLHQQGLHKRRSRRFPSFRELPGTSGNFPAEVELEVELLEGELEIEYPPCIPPEGEPQKIKPNRSCVIPTDFPLSDSLRSWAIKAGPTLNITVELDQFKDYHLAKGSLMKNWDAAFRTWIRNAIKFSKGGNNSRPETSIGVAETYKRQLAEEETDG